ncbi:DUF2970 domain-containing protein [Hydrogenophaga sp. YM1]|jgi:hypothetical protein|uniref:DUF2970 domain-containing protein n=1 Tax=Hydrogenophaga TaxID=47420 RepID=UPI0008788A2B|nr:MULTISPECIES: DUF2970 domain-containing protein [unclassified Hydrogenophaga]MBN9372809.1 DUF2970 domain-containing protein [Hydrogenophaga sp.]OJV47721.1 MAG: hypothetical protein BGO22_19870 [Hydrogenophaga sp. 70-12]QRR33672.1 DUF2970 domain-containing protein [Hydrogenophaga sp. YM1]
MSITREIKTVLWGLIGVARRSRLEAPSDHPLVLIAVAFVLVLVFLGTLAFIALQAPGALS